MEDYKYLAFISYSHHDSSVVRELQKRIEKFKLPLHIANKYNSGKRYIGENRLIYSTETSVNIRHNLWREEMEKNIDASKFLLIICTKHTRDSDYCLQERQYFRKNHCDENMICVLLDGDPEIAIPEDMRSFRPSGSNTVSNNAVTSALPRYCNYNHPDKKMRNMEFEMLISKLLDCDYDVFADRIKEYQRKRLITILLSIIFASVIALIYLAYSSFQIRRHYKQSLINQAESKALQSDEAFSADDRVGAIKYALEALPYSNKDIPVTNHAVRSLERSIGAYIIPETNPYSAAFTYNMENNIYAYTAYTNPHTNYSYIGIADRLDNIAVWNSSTGEKVFTDIADSTVEKLIDISFFNNYFFVLYSNMLLCYDIENSSLVWKAAGYYAGSKDYKNPVIGGKYLVFNKNDGTLFVGSYSGIYKFDIDEGGGTFISLYSWGEYAITDITISSDGNIIAYAKWSGDLAEIHLCDLTKKSDKVFNQHVSEINRLVFDSLDQLYIACSTSKKESITNGTVWQIIDSNQISYYRRDHIEPSEYQIYCVDNELKEIWSDAIQTVSGNTVFFYNYSYVKEEQYQDMGKEQNDVLCFAAGNSIWLRDTKSGEINERISLNGNVVAIDLSNDKKHIIACTDNGEITSYNPEDGVCEIISSINGGIFKAIVQEDNCYVLRKDNLKRAILYSDNCSDPSWNVFEGTDYRHISSSDYGIIPVEGGFLDTGVLSPFNFDGLITFYDIVEGKVQWTAKFSEDKKVDFLGMTDNDTKAVYVERQPVTKNHVETKSISIVYLDVKSMELSYDTLPQEAKFNPTDDHINIMDVFSWKNKKLYFVYRDTDTLHYHLVCYNTKSAFKERQYKISDISQFIGNDAVSFSSINIDDTESFLSLGVTNLNKESRVFVFNLRDQDAYELDLNTKDRITWNIKKGELYAFGKGKIYIYNCGQSVRKAKEIPVGGDILGMIQYDDYILALINIGNSVSLIKYRTETGEQSGIILISMGDPSEEYINNWSMSINYQKNLLLTYNGAFDNYYMMEIDMNSMETISMIPHATSYNERESCFFSRRDTGKIANGHSVMDIGYFYKHNLDELYKMGEKITATYDDSTFVADKSNFHMIDSYTTIESIDANPKGPVQQDKEISSVKLLIKDVEAFSFDMIPVQKDEPSYVQTTGLDNLVLKKDKTLWYFGQESDTPVQIMKNVKDFSLKLNTDTYGANDPAALILCEDGSVYGCGSTVFGTLGTDQNGNMLTSKKHISFLSPEKVAENIKEIWRGYRYSLVLDQTGTLFLWTSDSYYYKLDRGISWEEDIQYTTDVGNESIPEYLEGGDVVKYKNVCFVMSDTYQQAQYPTYSFFIAVMTDGSVWTCHLPDPYEGDYYSTDRMRMGDGTPVVKETPVKVFEAGTCW